MLHIAYKSFLGRLKKIRRWRNEKKIRTRGGLTMGDLMRREPGRLFRDLWEDFLDRTDFTPTRRRQGWAPAVDVKETDKAYILEADLPGLTEKDVDVRVEGDTLTLSSQKEEERKEEREGYLRRERYSRAFQRSFRLPDDVDRDKIDAKFEKGVLTLNLPRTGEQKESVKKIEVKTS
jgi:HSP20 family molecular chaperone IbpA